MSQRVLFLTGLVALAGCGGRAVVGDDGGGGGTSECPERLKQLADLSIGIGIASEDLRVRNAQACHAILDELGDAGPALTDPLPPGEARDSCEEAGASLEMGTAGDEITVSWPPLYCAPVPMTGSACQSACTEDGCAAICSAIEVAYSSCETPVITAIGGDPALGGALAIHLRPAAETIAWLPDLTMILADPLIEQLTDFVDDDLSAPCTELLLDVVESTERSTKGLDESADAAAAILAPVQ